MIQQYVLYIKENLCIYKVLFTWAITGKFILERAKKKVFFWGGLSVVSRQSYGSFVCTVSLVVISFVPRPHLHWSGYKTTCSRVAETLEAVPSLGHFYHVNKPTKRRLLQAIKVPCESVLQAIISSLSFRLSSPNAMKAVRAGRTNSPCPHNSMKACQSIYRSMH